MGFCCFGRIHGDLVGGLYHQVLLSLQKVLSDPVRPLCSHYGAVVGLHALGWKVGPPNTRAAASRICRKRNVFNKKKKLYGAMLSFLGEVMFHE